MSRYGGIYVDIDYDCVKRMDIFHHAFDFYGAIRLLPGLFLKWPEVIKSPVLVCNSLIGSIPGHPILDDYRRRVRENTGSPAIIDLAHKLSAAEKRNQKSIPRLVKARLELLTTYTPFTDAVTSLCKADADCVIAMPPPFFNPIDNWWHWERFRYPMYWTKALGALLKNGYHPYAWKQIPDCAFCVHHSSGFVARGERPTSRAVNSIDVSPGGVLRRGPPSRC